MTLSTSKAIEDFVEAVEMLTFALEDGGIVGGRIKRMVTASAAELKEALANEPVTPHP